MENPNPQLNQVEEPSALPAEKPPQVVEAHRLLREKIAGVVNNPIAKVNINNNDVYVPQMRNTQQHAMSPAALSNDGGINIKGERRIDLTQNLQTEIRTKAPTVPLAPQVNQQPPQPQAQVPPAQIPEADQNYNQKIKQQLDEINKMLFEQIKQKVADELKRQKTTALPINAPSAGNAPKLPYAKSVEVKTPVLEPETAKLEQKPTLSKEPTGEEYKQHIKKLEEEVKHLVTEVEKLDSTFSIAKDTQNHPELTDINQRLAVDERVIKAAENWRTALTNLINSHSLAIRHLKEKTDFLEKHSGEKHPHHAKHEDRHKKQTPNFDFPKIKEPNVTINQPEKAEEIKIEPNPQIIIVEKPAVPPTPVQQPVAQVPQISNPTNIPSLPPQQITTTPPVQPVATKTTEEKTETEKPDHIAGPRESVGSNTFENVRDMLSKISEKEIIAPPPPTTAQPTQAPKTPEPSLPVKPVSNEVIKEVKPAVTNEDLKPQFQQLKAGLTNLSSDMFKNLTTDQRKEMIRKLEILEKDSEVLRQFDELRALKEKRRINEELKSMFTNLQKPAVPVATTDPTRAKIEDLKQEQKKVFTPADKAKVIAEIKQLEREAAAKKSQEVQKPVVKAQPAYGKMLPNVPTIPNVISGIIKDSTGLLLPGVVIMVKNPAGQPVRAFRPNKLGQFTLSTPLPDGTYTLELEKEGYDFDIIEITANGSIMSPIEIRAKALK